MYIIKIHYFDSKVVRHYSFDSLFRLLKFIWYLFTNNFRDRISSVQIFKEC